jgi:hypothetical protein
MIELQLHLTNLQMREQIVTHLQTLTIYTTHMRPCADNFCVRVDDLTVQNAHYVQALGGYLDITVRQYYTVKHRLRLAHPYLPCVIEYGGIIRNHNNNRRHRRNRTGHFASNLPGRPHRSFYPLEVLCVKNINK